MYLDYSHIFIITRDAIRKYKRECQTTDNFRPKPAGFPWKVRTSQRAGSSQRERVCRQATLTVRDVCSIIESGKWLHISRIKEKQSRDALCLRLLCKVIISNLEYEVPSPSVIETLFFTTVVYSPSVKMYHWAIFNNMQTARPKPPHTYQAVEKTAPKSSNSPNLHLY